MSSVPPSAAASLAAPGSTIGTQYQVVKHLGGGAMGDVFLARDIELDRFVAIKLLRRDLSGRLENDARFRREARMLSRFNHPHVVVVHAIGTTPGGLHHIVMEYIEGETLEARLDREDHLDAATFCHVFGQIASAVAEAHRQGIVHRDLKPANVILAALAHDPNYVKVLDFGVAKVFGQDGGERDANLSLTQKGDVIGTPYYMSPEQVRSKPVDGRSDIFALGVIACELLTGRRPHEGSNFVELVMALVNAPPVLPSRLRPELGFPVDGPIDAVLARALEKDQGKRYDAVTDFSRDLLAEVRRFAGLVQGGLSLAPPTLGPVPSRAPVTQVSAKPPSSVVIGTADLGATMPAAIASDGPGQIARGGTVLHLEIHTDPYTDEVDFDEYIDCLALVGAKIQQAVALHRGVAIDPLTDRQVAIFAAQADGNDVERAIDAALAIRSALSAFATDPTVPTSFRLAFRIGIAPGRIARADSSGSAPVIYGSAFFEARALVQSGLAGEVRISRAGYRRARGLYECELPGHSGPDAGAMVVLTKKLTTHLKPNEIYGVRIDLFGRAAELDALRAALRSVVETGVPRAVFVTGPAGVGKSRILAEFIKELDDGPKGTPHFYETGRCTAGWQGRPYEPFIQAIRWRARIQEEDLVDQSKLKLEHYVRRFVAADATRLDDAERQLEGHLAELLGLDEEEEGRERTSDESNFGGDEPQRKKLFDAVTMVFRRLAMRHPLVFVIEDFEWATPPTTSLLGHMLARLGDVPVLFLVGARTEGEADLDLSFVRDASCATRTPMAPLDAKTAEALTRHMLRELVEVPGWLVRGITALAGGVPLIIEETIHDLIDERIIAVDGDRWKLTRASATALELPSTVHELLLGRLERLGPDLLAALQTAAVAGRRFWPAMLDELAEGGFSAEKLELLVSRGFFVERREIMIRGESDHAFSQLAVQEAVYRSVPKARRRQLHKAVATWLEQRTRGTRARHDDALGHHFVEAGEPFKALPYLREAADRAMRVHAIDEATQHLESCREILSESAPGEMPEKDRRQKLAAVLADLVHQLVLSGNLERAATLGSEALAADAGDRPVNAPVPMARVAIWRGWALEHRGRYAEARESFLVAQGLLGKDGGILMLMAITGEAGTTDKLGDPDGCAQKLRAALGSYERGNAADPLLERALSSAHRVLANAQMRLGAYDAALATFDRAYDLALSANAPVEAVDALNSLGANHYFRGQLTEAESKWRIALEQADQWDLLQHKSIILSNMGELEWTRGDAVKALAMLERAEALHSYLHSDEGLADTYRLMSECRLALGAVDLAEQRATQSLELAERLGSPTVLGTCHRTMATVAHAALGTKPNDAQARARVSQHIGASLAAFEKAGMAGEVERTKALAEKLAVG